MKGHTLRHFPHDTHALSSTLALQKPPSSRETMIASTGQATSQAVHPQQSERSRSMLFLCPHVLGSSSSAAFSHTRERSRSRASNRFGFSQSMDSANTASVTSSVASLPLSPSMSRML